MKIEYGMYDEYMGTPLDRWYRVAYLSQSRAVSVCYPIGIHWVIRVGRRVWEWSLHYRPSRHEIERDAIARRYEARISHFREENTVLRENKDAIEQYFSRVGLGLKELGL